MEVSKLMSKNPVTCDQFETAKDAARKMKDHKLGMIPVLSKRKLLGIVTDRDLCLSVLSSGSKAESIILGDLMKSPVVCCRHDDDLETAIDLLKTYKIRRLPVLDSKGRLTGVLSSSDLWQYGQPTESLRKATIEITDSAQSELTPAEGVFISPGSVGSSCIGPDF